MSDNDVGSIYLEFTEYKREPRDILRVNLKYVTTGEKRWTGLGFTFRESRIARSVICPIVRPQLFFNWYREDQMVFNPW